MSCSKTPEELAVAVLREMAVIDAAESPDELDEDLVIGTYQIKYAELSAHGLEYAYWPHDEIPNAVFLIVRDLVINEVSGAFGQPVAPSTKDAEETVILKRLRRHTGRQATGLPNRAEYF